MCVCVCVCRISLVPQPFLGSQPRGLWSSKETRGSTFSNGTNASIILNANLSAYKQRLYADFCFCFQAVIKNMSVLYTTAMLYEVHHFRRAQLVLHSVYQFSSTQSQSDTAHCKMWLVLITQCHCFCRADVSKLKFEGKTFYVIGIQKEVSILSCVSWPV